MLLLDEGLPMLHLGHIMMVRQTSRLCLGDDSVELTLPKTARNSPPLKERSSQSRKPDRLNQPSIFQGGRLFDDSNGRRCLRF